MRWCTIRFRDMSLLFLQTNIIGGQALFNHQKLNPNRWSISEPSEYTRCIGCQHRGCFWSSSLALTAWRVPEMMSLKKCRCTVIYTTNHEMVKDGERRWKTVKDGERLSSQIFSGNCSMLDIHDSPLSRCTQDKILPSVVRIRRTPFSTLDCNNPSLDSFLLLNKNCKTPQLHRRRKSRRL